jgi:two-component system response regulator YesN
MLIEIPSNVPDFKIYLLVRELLGNILESYGEVLHFAGSADRQILIIKGDDPVNMNETAYVLAGAISVSIQKQLDITVYVGIGRSVGRVREISNSYGEACRACKYIQFIGNGQIASFSDLTREERSRNFERLANNAVLERLKYTNYKDSEKLAEQYVNDIGETGKTSMLLSNYLMVDMLVCAARYIKELGGNPSEVLPGFDSDSQQFFTLFEGSSEKLSAIITDIVKKTISFRDSCNTSKHSVAIKKAKEYIKENFNDPSMSLYTVAKVVAISPNYFSTIFSQETGELFIEYLTGVRIARSKELLVTSNMLLADIARQVGYNEPHYFNYLFKKYVGVPPGVYRNKNKYA